jgi:response regulator RpfG family c-di-GMP phosphodiesterase
MTGKILFVDDEPAVLDGYRRLLGRNFPVDTAIGGAEGLAAIEESGPYAVVISDMRMPEMDGAQFLAKVRVVSPATTRLALTGYVDIDTAIGAVNEGNIFRFLTKPCSKENLLSAIEAGLEQNRLVNAERELLEQTLRRSVHLLSEVLSFSNPAAFGRAMRLRRFVQHVVEKLHLKAGWQYEIAAMLSQIGCVTLPPELVNAVCAGAQMTPEEQKKFDTHASLGSKMLSGIPRMEAITQMIAQQNNPAPRIEAKSPEQKREIECGIQLLRTALAFESLISHGLSPDEAVKTVRVSMKYVDQAILDSLDGVALSFPMQMRDCAVSDLALGMILQQDLSNNNGLLLVAKGQEITPQWIERLKGFSQAGVIGKRLCVAMPQNTAD